MFATGSVLNEVEHTVVRHAGGPAYYAVNDGGVAVEAGADVGFVSLTVEEGLGVGLTLGDGARVSVDGFVARGWAGPLAEVGPDTWGALRGAVDGGDNLEPFVDVRGGVLADEVAVSALDVPWRLQGTVDVEGGLSMGPGVHVVVAADQALWFGEAASVQLVGASDDPVRFSPESGPTSWRGLVLTSVDPTNALRDLVVEGAGSAPYFSPDEASIAVVGGQGALTRVTVLDGGGACLALDDTAEVSLDGNDWDGCAASVSLPPHAMGWMDPGSRHGAPLAVRGGIVDGDLAVPTLDAPFHVGGPIDAYGVWTASAGADLRFARGAALWVDAGGGLRLEGTAAAPVSLSAIDAVPGGWSGVVLVSDDPANVVRFATIRHGGGAPYFASASANLSVEAGARLDLSSTSLEDSDDWGLFVADGGRVTATDVTYAGNTRDERMP